MLAALLEQTFRYPVLQYPVFKPFGFLKVQAFLPEGMEDDILFHLVDKGLRAPANTRPP